MSWVRYDDSVAFHHKVVEAGNEACGAWMRMTAWSSSQLTDGRIPLRIALLIAEKQDVLATLVRVGLLDQDGENYVVHDYHDHNAKAADVREKRRQEAERKAIGRRNQVRADNGTVSGRTNGGRPSGQTADSERTIEGVRDLSGCPSAGPDPTRPILSSSPTPSSEGNGIAEVERAWNTAELGGLHGALAFEALADGLRKLELDPVVACKTFKRIVLTWSRPGKVSPSKMLEHIGAVQGVLRGEVQLPDDDPPPRRDSERYSEIRKRMGV